MGAPEDEAVEKALSDRYVSRMTHTHTHTPLTHAHWALHFNAVGSCLLGAEMRGSPPPCPTLP